VAVEEVGAAIASIHAALAAARARPRDAIEADRATLVGVVERIRTPELDGEAVAVA
jgi:predicted trehalose synthase